MKNMKPVIYQLLPRLFGNLTSNPVPNGSIERNGSGKLSQINDAVIESIGQLGCTHIWLTGVIEHAHRTDYSAFGIAPDNPYVVKGNAGSPYAISDYYDIDPDIAENVEDRMAEFEQTVKRIHAHDMKVIIDFVPNHVARRYHSDAKPADAPADLGADDNTTMAFSPNNNFYYLPGQEFAPRINLGSGAERYIEMPARASGNDCFTASPGINDWYETVKLNYGIDFATGTTHFNPIPSTWHKMLHILLYWAAKGVDGFRCDMAHMVPIEFWEWAIKQVKKQYKNVIFIAEIYEVGLYRDYIFRGGFDYLYDKVNLYDTLRAIQTMGTPASALTGCWMTVDGIEDHMLNFLENHDEQRYASQFYASDPLAAIPALTVSALLGRGAMMIYAGQELGERANDAEGFSGRDGRTTIFDYWSIPTLRRWLSPSGQPNNEALTPREQWLRADYKRILSLCNSQPALRDGAFFDVMYVNTNNPGINPASHYIFLRHKGKETMLVAVNFSCSSAEMQVTIPEHAFTTLGIKDGVAEWTDLLRPSLSGTISLTPNCQVPVFVPAHSAAVIKLTKSTKRK